jgi:hypothetical protein
MEAAMQQTSRILLSILFLVTAHGCSRMAVTDPAALYYLPPPGSRVEVKQRLEVPPGMMRVYLQHGRIIAKSARNDYAVNCNFEINSIGDMPRYIEPGEYIITRSQRRTDSIVGLEPVLVASLATSMAERGDGPPLMFEEIRLSLASTPPSDVRELACRGVMDYPAEILPPTLAEMRRALGDYAEIRVPGAVM